MKFKYKFIDEKLFELAMTQSGANHAVNNERLEFLGDRVLNLAIAELLYKTFADETEGELARRHAALVSAKILSEMAVKFGFDKTARHGHLTGGRKENVLADIMESVLGAMYLDGGWEAVREFIHKHWTDLARADKVAPKDPKTKLQEMAQHSGNPHLPVYEFAASKKRNEFVVTVTALGKTATGTGTSKKSATISAAESLLSIL